MLIGSSSERPRALADLLGPDLCDRLDRLDLLSRRVFGGKLPGERRSKARGQSVEFDDYREYTGGDDLRHIDWNVMARLDRVMVKLFREDKDLSLHLAIDTSPSMLAGEARPGHGTHASPTKLVCSLRVAMALAYLGLVNRNRVSVSTFGGALSRLAPLRGRGGIARIADFLIEASAPVPSGGGRSGFFEAMRRLSTSGRGVLVVISDFLMDEDLRRGLNAISGGSRRGRAFEATCLQVLAPGELDPASLPELRGDVRLTDAESGQALDLTISAPVARTFERGLRDHVESIRALCAARGIGHLLVPCETDVAELMLSTLRRRGVIG